MDDLEFARRVARRDPGAMDSLVDRYHTDIYRFLRHLTRHQQEAEDLAQQTLLRVIERASRYSAEGSFRSWILGIAFREFTNWRRKRLWLPLLGDRVDPSDPFSSLAESEALLASLAKLPAKTRAMFLLHHVEEVSIAEIAIQLGLPEGTVKSRLHAARQKLRTFMKEDIYVTETV